VLQIAEQTLSGRTLGAEEPVLAEWIMGEKIKDIEMPSEEEMSDIIVVDSLRNVDDLLRICKVFFP